MSKTSFAKLPMVADHLFSPSFACLFLSAHIGTRSTCAIKMQPKSEAFRWHTWFTRFQCLCMTASRGASGKTWRQTIRTQLMSDILTKNLFRNLLLSISQAERSHSFLFGYSFSISQRALQLTSRFVSSFWVPLDLTLLKGIPTLLNEEAPPDNKATSAEHEPRGISS